MKPSLTLNGIDVDVNICARHWSWSLVLIFMLMFGDWNLFCQDFEAKFGKISNMKFSWWTLFLSICCVSVTVLWRNILILKRKLPILIKIVPTLFCWHFSPDGNTLFQIFQLSFLFCLKVENEKDLATWNCIGKCCWAKLYWIPLCCRGPWI